MNCYVITFGIPTHYTHSSILNQAHQSHLESFVWMNQKWKRLQYHTFSGVKNFELEMNEWFRLLKKYKCDKNDVETHLDHSDLVIMKAMEMGILGFWLMVCFDNG